MTRAEIATAFNVPIDKLPPKKGIGYTQPIMTGFTQASLIKYTAILAFLIIAIQIFFSTSATEKIVFPRYISQH